MTERTPALVAIVPCLDIAASESWWNRLGFTRPADQGYDDYRMLANDEGSEVHLNRVASLGFAPEHNPFGIYLYTPGVDALAVTLRAEIIEREKAATHKPWGMYEFAVNGPDDLLVRIGWPSRLVANALA